MAKSFFSQKNPEQRDAFNFPKWMKDSASARQTSRCAICGYYKERGALIGHHVIPVRHGCVNILSPNHKFIGSVSNCVMVCKQCHLKEAHGGHTAYGTLASADKFKFSHGGSQASHEKWLNEVGDAGKHTCAFFKLDRKKSKKTP